MNEKILIVDDQEINRLIVFQNLSAPLGKYQVTEAGNGKEAIDILEDDDNFEVILLDIMMPVMDGFKTLEKVKSSPNLKEIPIIMLTAKATTSDIVRALEMGAHDYIKKPFQVEELIARVNNLVKLSQSQKQIKEHVSLLESRSEMLHALAEGAHDLGNILNSLNIITVFLDEILADKNSNNFTELSNLYTNEKIGRKIDEAILLGTNILNSTMDLSQIGTIFPTTNNLQLLIEQSLAFLAYKIEKNDISVSTEIEDIKIYVAKDDWQRFFLNLFKNSVEALRASKTKKIIIKGYISKINTLILEIEDTGAGIDEDTKSKIMKSNFTTKEDGHGLGLSFVKKVVKKYEGSFSIESIVGEGTKFRFEFPENLISNQNLTEEGKK